MEDKEVQLTPEKETDYPYDLIVVLGANAKKDRRGSWKLPTILEEDPGKIVAGHSRAIACVEAYKENLAPIFLITGGLQENGEIVSRAELMADLIVNKYKVPREKVEVINSEPNTLGNVEAAVSFLRNHPEIIKRRRIGILTNDWHLPRAKEMFESNPYFIENSIEVVPFPVEELLEVRSGHYTKWIQRVRERPEMRERMRLEKNGLVDLKAGRYKSRR